MKRKLLTERQAWLLGAEEWAKAKKHDGHYWAYRRSRGLCSWISNLESSGLIDYLTYLSMRDKINCTHGLFLWPTNTAAGRNARVRFCLKQAKLLESAPQAESEETNEEEDQ